MKNHKLKKITIITITILLILLTLINIFIKNKIFMLIIISSMLIISIIMLLKNKKSEILELKSEIKSIVWPDKKEVNQTMLTVTLIIISSSLIIWLIDSMLTFLISKLI
jgi:preprotein translocase subunit SecE